MALKFYNTLSKQIEEFKPLDSNHVGVYTCGPTVYDYVHIGNWRTYTLSDLVVRTLAYNGYHVQYYMNITDVGHLTGDNSGDADTGEDRMEKAKKREGKNAFEIAKFYADDFKKGYKILNLSEPVAFLPATEHIPEQIALVEKLFENGLAYQISDGIYFDTDAYEKMGFEYGELSNLDQIKAGARVDFNPEKRNIRDFALWKFSPSADSTSSLQADSGQAKRDMEWPSPWGVGFPGWHIECSAMSMKYLGDQFDVHIGGEDLKSTHHPNEIAQSQGATSKSPFVTYWIHGAFLQIDGGRMGKSLGNAYTLADIIAHDINPLALRYFYLCGHYTSQLNFTWEALEGAHNALKHLYSAYLELGEDVGNVNDEYKNKFTEYINDNLNTPKAIALVWELIKDANITNADKKATLIDFDKVLGLRLEQITEEIVPEDVNFLVHKREIARKEKDWTRADEIRIELEKKGYKVKDSDQGTIVSKI